MLHSTVSELLNLYSMSLSKCQHTNKLEVEYVKQHSIKGLVLYPHWKVASIASETILKWGEHSLTWQDWRDCDLSVKFHKAFPRALHVNKAISLMEKGMCRPFNKISRSKKIPSCEISRIKSDSAPWLTWPTYLALYLVTVSKNVTQAITSLQPIQALQ